MVDEAFWQTSLPAPITAQETERVGQPSVHVTLRHGQAEKMSRILAVSPQRVRCAVSPPDDQPPRQPSAQAQQAGAPLHERDRLAIAESIVLIRGDPQTETARSGMWCLRHERGDNAVHARRRAWVLVASRVPVMGRRAKDQTSVCIRQSTNWREEHAQHDIS